MIMVIDWEVDHILDGNNKLVFVEDDWTIRAPYKAFIFANGRRIREIHLADLAGLNLLGSEADDSNARKE